MNYNSLNLKEKASICKNFLSINSFADDPARVHVTLTELNPDVFWREGRWIVFLRLADFYFNYNLTFIKT